MVMPLYVLFFNCNISVDTQNVQAGIVFQDYVLVQKN